MYRSILVAWVAFFLVPLEADAQCWECEVQYYPGNDCWMEGCWGTFEEGHWTECSQQGECDNEECETGGEICVPIPERALMDGRATIRHRLSSDLAVLRASPALEETREMTGSAFRVGCSGALVAVVYDPRFLLSLRSRTSSIAL